MAFPRRRDINVQVLIGGYAPRFDAGLAETDNQIVSLAKPNREKNVILATAIAIPHRNIRSRLSEV